MIVLFTSKSLGKKLKVKMIGDGGMNWWTFFEVVDILNILILLLWLKKMFTIQLQT